MRFNNVPHGSQLVILAGILIFMIVGFYKLAGEMGLKNYGRLAKKVQVELFYEHYVPT